MAIVLICTECREGYRYLTGAFPLKCPRCGKATSWQGATLTSDDEPAKPYDLTADDAVFLKIQKIDPEQPLAALAQD